MKRVTPDLERKTASKYRATAVALFLWFSYLLVPSSLTASAPTEQLRDTVEQVLAILSNSKPKSDGEWQEFRTRLAQAIYPRFDFTEMAKRSLGSYWGSRNSGEQEEFVKAFAGFLGRSYVGTMQSYGNQKVLYTREVKHTDAAEVDTKIVTDKPQALSVNYKLHLVNEEWKVYDVVIDNISMVTNYHSQFNRVLARSSFEELVRIIKEKGAGQ